MKCAIMQPTYLPWAGYFSLMDAVDIFVIFDDVQFSKGSWHQRNRILHNGKEQFLTIPIRKKGKSKQLIFEVEIDQTKPWKRKHLETIRQAYGKHPFSEDILPLVTTILEKEYSKLIEINVTFIQKFTEKLGLSPKILFSSELPVSGKRSEYIVNICEYLQVETYVSPPGAKEYVEEDGLFQNSSIQLKYFEYPEFLYPQKGSSDFIPQLSIVDMVANIGWDEAKKMIRRGGV